MAKEPIIKQLFSGNWLPKDALHKNYKTFGLIVLAFVVMLIQQYRMEALFVKANEYKLELTKIRTEYVYSSVELMNTTLEAVIAKKIKHRGLDLETPEKMPVIIEMPKENSDKDE